MNGKCACPPGSEKSLFGFGNDDTAGLDSDDHECSLCQAGAYADGVTESRCENCPNGTYSMILGATSVRACLECPSGWTNTDDRQACKCSPGFLSTDLGFYKSCSACPENTYESLGACQPCEPGTYSAIVAATSRKVCTNLTTVPTTTHSVADEDTTGDIFEDTPDGIFEDTPGDTFADTPGDTVIGKPGPGGTFEGTPGGTFEGTPGGTFEGTPGGIFEGTPGGTFEGTPGGTVVGTPGPGGTFEGTPGGTAVGTPGPGDTFEDTPGDTVIGTPGPGDTFEDTPGGIVIGTPGPGNTFEDTHTPDVVGDTDGDKGTGDGISPSKTTTSVEPMDTHPTLTCSAGKFTNKNGLCISCAVGKFSKTVAALSCQQCQAGATSNDDRTGCVCRSGYRPVADGVCSPCPIATFQPSAGSLECTPCPSGTYSPHIASTSPSTCMECPDHMINVDRKRCDCHVGMRHTSQTACECLSGYIPMTDSHGCAPNPVKLPIASPHKFRPKKKAKVEMRTVHLTVAIPTMSIVQFTTQKQALYVSEFARRVSAKSSDVHIRSIRTAYAPSNSVASAAPRRRNLLAPHGIDVETEVTSTVETTNSVVQAVSAGNLEMEIEGVLLKTTVVVGPQKNPNLVRGC